MIGGLCRKERPLCKSHLVPASAYKRIRNTADGAPAADPVRISGSVATLTSQQLSKPFLCRLCERLFSDHGERYIMSLCPGSEKFQLREMLADSTPVHTGVNSTQTYDLDAVDPTNLDSYIYFVLSIVWRARATDWSVRHQKAPQCELGRYLEPLRKYLFLEGPVPDHVYILLWALVDEPLDLTIVPPCTERVPNGRGFRHWFIVPGLLAQVYIGQKVPNSIPALSLTTPGIKAIFAGGFKDTPRAHEIYQMVSRSVAQGLLSRARDAF